MSKFEEMFYKATLMVAESGLFETVLNDEVVKPVKMTVGSNAPINIETPVKTKSKRGRKKKADSDKVGKMIVPTTDEFFNRYKNKAMEMIRSRTVKSKGNHEKIVDFLATTWKNRKTFSRKDIIVAMTEKYPDKSEYNDDQRFRTQAFMWFGAKREKTNEFFIYPVAKRIDRGLFENPFFTGE